VGRGLARSDAGFCRLAEGLRAVAGVRASPWGRPAELRETAEIARRLGPFAHLFKELRVLDAIPAAERGRLVPDLPTVPARCVAVAADARAQPARRSIFASASAVMPPAFPWSTFSCTSAVEPKCETIAKPPRIASVAPSAARVPDTVFRSIPHIE
jgi:hypothetical protein